MSVLKAALAVRRRRYGVLRLLADYRLIVQSALCYAKQCDLIKSEKTFLDAMDVSARQSSIQRAFSRFNNETIFVHHSFSGNSILGNKRVWEEGEE